MVLELHPCTEADLPEFVRIQIAAFNYGGGMTQFMVEFPPSEAYINKSIDKHIKSMREEKDVAYLKVIDTELDNQMIAGAKWRINQKERTEEEIQSMLPVPSADEADKQAVTDFMWYLNRVRREFMGTKPFYCKCDRLESPFHDIWFNALQFCTCSLRIQHITAAVLVVNLFDGAPNKPMWLNFHASWNPLS
jgi:hypothetical protein